MQGAKLAGLAAGRAREAQRPAAEAAALGRHVVVAKLVMAVVVERWPVGRSRLVVWKLGAGYSSWKRESAGLKVLAEDQFATQELEQYQTVQAGAASGHDSGAGAD